MNELLLKLCKFIIGIKSRDEELIKKLQDSEIKSRKVIDGTKTLTMCPKEVYNSKSFQDNLEKAGKLINKPK